MTTGLRRQPHRALILAALAGFLSCPAVATSPDAAIEQAAPAPSARWDNGALRQLVKAIEQADREGLDPQAYNLAALRSALNDGPGATRDILAEAAALRLANDYYFGRVTDRTVMQWMITRPDYERAQLPERLRRALAGGEIDRFYASLLPDNKRYEALREALASESDPALRDRIRVNMERWRWMPRTISDDHIYVNVPSYRLDVVEGGSVLSSYDVVVGAKATPTPLMVSPANSLVVNPPWYVPASIVKSSNIRAGRGGYYAKPLAGGGYAVVQPPGPRNALGRIKVNLVNDQAIFLHDTPTKSAFKRDARALSHGCIRVSDIDRLASELMAREGGDATALEEALSGSSTRQLPLPRQWPVYLVYFTMDLDADGALVSYPDPYDYDAAMLARLGSTQPIAGGMTVASLRR
jgi:L,D-transpeptidase YcbB